MIQRIEAPARLQVKAGRKIQIPAVPIGAQKHERMLLYVIIAGGGEVEKNGFFTAPVVYDQAISRVKIIAAFDNAKTAEIEIVILPIAIEGISAPKTLQVKSGKPIQIRARAIGAGENEKGLAYFLVKGDGEVDSNGIYYAPITAVDLNVKIKVASTFDQTKFAIIKINVKAITVKRVEAPKALQIKSGKTVRIHATAIGDVKNLLFSLEQGEGEIDSNGIFTASVSFMDIISKVKVTSEFDPTKYAIVEIITKAIKPMKILPSANLRYPAGKEKTFVTKFELPVDIYWHIIDLGTDTGNIDPLTGKYRAPDVIPVLKTVKIEAIDQIRPNNKAEVKITLLPVEMRIGTQQPVHAGEKNIPLAIESHNDLSGLNNFTCEVISRPWVGQISDDNKYTPPSTVDKPRKVKIKATSKRDKSKFVVLGFEIDFSLCRRCEGITDAAGFCAVCGMPRSYGTILR